jgi:hypothetical protein
VGSKSALENPMVNGMSKSVGIKDPDRIGLLAANIIALFLHTNRAKQEYVD